jgi:outer membrane protein OmpA-like peptidoglycan-associated protein
MRTLAAAGTGLPIGFVAMGGFELQSRRSAMLRMFRNLCMLCVAISMVPTLAAGQIGGIKVPKVPKIPTVPTVPTAPAPTTQAPTAEPAPTAAAQPGATPAATPAKNEAPGSGVWVNYDFQPGEIPLYVDDFSRDRVGNFPQRLEFGEGNMEIAEWNGMRYLRVTTRDARFSVVLPEVLPDRFTIEFDATPPNSNISATIEFSPGANSHVDYHYFNTKMMGGIDGTGPRAMGAERKESAADALFRFRIMGDGKYVKVYINDTRVANVPNADLGRSKTITFVLSGTEDQPAFIGNFSILAGGRELYDALVENGRVATQGIYFDTGSDHIRPESTPTLVEIAQMMKGHPDLSLLIEGHTDNVGSAASNQSLSERRAAAVKQALVDTWSVDSNRLATAGFGATKPAAPNTTPEGRQQNRRVELVKK